MSVLLIDGESPFSAPVSYCLATANRTVHLGSSSRFADVRFSRFRKKFRWWKDESRLLENVRNFAREERIEIIMACSDPGIRFLSEHRRELESLAAVAGTPSGESLDATVDKANFAQLVSRAKLPHPDTVALEAGEPLPQRLPCFPALLKPARGSGGALIARLEEPGALERLMNTGALESQRWILQSYIYGRDIDCSVVCRQGQVLAYTIQSSVHLPATSFAPVGAVEFVNDAETLSLAEKLVAELQWTGIAHIDMLRSHRDGRLYLIEMNGRYWASMLGSFRAGVNFPELACLDALGKVFTRPVQQGIRFVRGSFKTAWREARRPAETTLFWRLSDPGPLFASQLRSIRPHRTF
jgi:D-aspartate ligase